tara:strand:+ start:2744 stop:2980 length:237 start_codon:yes stop_codon:yes gene_type:complete
MSNSTTTNTVSFPLKSTTRDNGMHVSLIYLIDTNSFELMLFDKEGGKVLIQRDSMILEDLIEPYKMLVEFDFVRTEKV